MTLSRIDRYLFGFLIAGVVIFLCAHPLKENQFGPQSDEGYYYHYAQMVAQKGNSAFTDLIGWYAGSDEARKHPTPLRAGYILLAAGLFKIYGPSYSLLALASMAFFLSFLAMCFYYSRRHFGLDIALIFTFFLSVSPLMLGLSRRALLDSPINFLWGSAAWLFLDFLSRRSGWKYAFFILVLCLSITVKEMSVVLIPFFVSAGLWARWKGMPVKVWEILGIVLIPTLVVLFFYTWVLGGTGPLWLAVQGIARTHFDIRYPNLYAIDFCSGPWFRYLLDFLLLTPVVTLFFIGYCFMLLCERGVGDWKQKYFLGYFIFVYAVLSSLAHSKIVRVAVNLEMVMALFTVFMLTRWLMPCPSHRRKVWLLYAALAIFLFNVDGFLRLFYFSGLLDPITYNLLVLRGFIPAH